MSSVESPEEIGSIWRMLENRVRPSRDGLEVYRTGTEMTGQPVLLGLDRHGNRHVLVSVSPEVTVTPDQRSGGVHLLTRVLTSSGRDHRFIDLVCTKPHLENVFSVFAGELLEQLGALGEDDPAPLIRRVLEDWRELFERAPGGTLGPGALAGLFGELWHLKRMCRRSGMALSSWKGPSGGRFDFRVARCALEVKATLRRHGRVVEIHGHRQLEAPPEGDLFLGFLKLEKAEIGTSVPDLVNDLREMVSDRTELTKKLASAGYDEADETTYREYRYHVEEDLVFRVDRSFPRIIPDSFRDGELPAGVLSMSYTIDLSGPEPPPLDAPDIDVLHERLAGASEQA